MTPPSPEPGTTAPAPEPGTTAVSPRPPYKETTPTYQTPVAGAPRSGASIGPATPPGVEPTEQGVFPPTPPQFTIETADHVNRLRIGLLIQGQYEAHGASSSQGLTQNLFVRRAGILLGGRFLKYFDYFFGTDYSNVQKENTATPPLKAGPSIQVKDIIGTIRAVEDEFKIDFGLMLPPGSHNFLQGSSTLYGWDFFLNSYRFSNAFGSQNDPYGRDLGVQLRGLVLNKFLEYRAGVFQGVRNPPVVGPPAGSPGRNSFRVAGRVQLNFLDPETGYFYGGTYLGTQKVFSVGAFGDYQHDQDNTYRSYGGDALLDAYNVTAQIDVVYRNGGGLATTIPRNTAFEGEVGYRFEPIHLAPVFRFERRWQAGGGANDETDTGGGLAWFAFGHTANLKAFYTRLIPGGSAKGYDQVNVQAQLAFF
ncbi:MAG TPA: hypothetical protein VHC69_29820 [Polyangiaceae bacterium]|nr:hypothetical protein [Polyangiaceae bacterium]